jgi:hypothetical protein
MSHVRACAWQMEKKSRGSLVYVFFLFLLVFPRAHHLTELQRGETSSGKAGANSQS